MLVKLTADQIAKLGAKDPADASVKLTAFFSAAAQLETAMANQPDFASLESRIAALEKVPCGTTEARVKELITAESAVPIKTFIASVEGKQLIGAEASRVVMEAQASIGTTPAKPSPAAPGAESVTDMEAAGEYEKAFAASKDLRAEFPSAKHYAAFAKANSEGRIVFNRPQAAPSKNN